ncbi:hypothetical protein MSAN_02521300 [Mycena sanguinolenta]|uniref:Uncharacterized protein n=1 Tax=Mycena sanguinolenta TaxID=230812 RepID=A0A8H6WP13_9AGAR|nr:hypothetical protein MSAN_02521300 [Mycena sanguinolenta]
MLMTLPAIAEQPDARAGSALIGGERSAIVLGRRESLPTATPLPPLTPDGLLAHYRPDRLALATTNGDYATGDGRHLACACPPRTLALERCAASRRCRFLDSQGARFPRLAQGAIHPVRSVEVAKERKEGRRWRALRRDTACAKDGGASSATGYHIVALSARARRRARGRAPRTGSGPSLTTRDPPRQTYSPRHLADGCPRSSTRGSCLTLPACDSSAPWRWKGQEGRAAGGDAMQRVEGAGGEMGQHCESRSNNLTKPYPFMDDTGIPLKNIPTFATYGQDTMGGLAINTSARVMSARSTTRRDAGVKLADADEGADELAPIPHWWRARADSARGVIVTGGGCVWAGWEEA